MKEVLDYMIKALVTDKNQVSIDEETEGNFIRYTVHVAKDDFGKVIGHEGKIARSIRQIMGAIATLRDIKVVVDIR